VGHVGVFPESEVYVKCCHRSASTSGNFPESIVSVIPAHIVSFVACWQVYVSVAVLVVGIIVGFVVGFPWAPWSVVGAAIWVPSNTTVRGVVSTC
jgi:hypothetical protein